MTDNVAIIPARTGYCAGYCAALNEIAAERKYLSVYGGFTVEGSESFSLYCRENGYPQLFALDTADDRVVGWCDVVPRESAPSFVGYLGIGLLPDYRGKGLGGRMINQALELACKRGFRVIRLECRASNERALRLYEKLGFRKYKYSKRGLCIEGEYFPIVYMKKRLNRRGCK